MTAILKEDPPELSAIRGGIAPGLGRIVRHSLEKNPEGRFQSARDLAFDLEALSAGSGSQSAGTALGAARARRVAMLTAVAFSWRSRWRSRRAAPGGFGLASPLLNAVVVVDRSGRRTEIASWYERVLYSNLYIAEGLK